MKFLDLKEGCKIVSLRSFVPDNWQIRDRNSDDPRNLLWPVVKKEYFSGSVSWTDMGGFYFVATKDSRKLRKFMERQEKQGKLEKLVERENKEKQVKLENGIVKTA